MASMSALVESSYTARTLYLLPRSPLLKLKIFLKTPACFAAGIAEAAEVAEANDETQRKRPEIMRLCTAQITVVLCNVHVSVKPLYRFRINPNRGEGNSK